MAQISYIKYTDVLETRRYDAEYFRDDVISLLKKENIKFINLGENISKFGTGENLEQTDFEDKTSSVYFLRTQQIRSIYIDDNGLKNLKNSNKFTKIKTGDLIFTRVGEGVGNSSIITQEYENSAVSDNVIILKLKNLNPFFVSVFLNIKYGQLFLNRTKKGTARGLISRDNFSGIFVPDFSHLNNLCEENIKKYYVLQAQSKQLYREAEELLLRELGLLDYQVKHSLCFTTTKTEVNEAHRYDSEYFQPKYADINKKIENYEGGWDLVKNEFKIINGKTPEQYFEEEKEIQVLKTKQIRNEAIQYESVAYSEKEFVTNILQERDVLFASMGVGSLGRTGIFYNFETDKKTSVDSTIKIFRNPKKIEPEVLQTFFNSIIGQEYIYRYVVGSTGIISIKNDFILDLKIPLIKPSIQKQIAEKIQESHKLRKESKELLEEAKRKVEEEIEK